MCFLLPLDKLEFVVEFGLRVEQQAATGARPSFLLLIY